MGERGWSFIELLVCAAVLSLLAAAVLPKTAHWLEERRLDSEAACMVAELRLLQEMTRSASRPQDALWGKNTTGVPVMRFTRRSYMIFQGGDFMMEHPAPAQVHYVFPRDELYFQPGGDAEPATIYIYLGATSRRVIVDRVGRLRAAAGD